MSFNDEDAVLAEAGRSQAIGIDVHVDLATTLAAFRQRADLHHLALGADGNVTVGAIVRAVDDFRCNKAAHLAQSGHRRTGGYDGTSTVKDDPNLTLSCHDCGLVDEADQTARLITGLRVRRPGLCDIATDVEI